MTQAERRLYLIQSLLNEKTEYQSLNVPRDAGEQRKLLRSLMNVRTPKAADESFLHVQDAYLQQEMADEGITDLDDLQPVSGDLYIWQGDITRLKCGAIVNAANSGMTGCYIPCHACIDNCIHTFAGVQLRQDCAALMAEQGHEEPTGQAKITKAYNLPCDYVLHTVGPIVSGRVTREDERLLASCYRSCLELAEKNSVRSIAFCCISTGVFHFPNERAAEIAVETVRRYKVETGSKIKVVFNVFKDLDKTIYERLHGANDVMLFSSEKKSNQLFKKIKTNLKKKNPVILSVGGNIRGNKTKHGPEMFKLEKNSLIKFEGRRQYFDEHYVTITGILTNEQDNTYRLQVSSWGEKYYIKYHDIYPFVKNHSLPMMCDAIFVAKNKSS